MSIHVFNNVGGKSIKAIQTAEDHIHLHFSFLQILNQLTCDYITTGSCRFTMISQILFVFSKVLLVKDDDEEDTNVDTREANTKVCFTANCSLLLPGAD